MTLQWWIQDLPGGPNSKGEAPTYYLVIFPPENCIKMKEFEPRGGRTPLVSLFKSANNLGPSLMVIFATYFLQNGWGGGCPCGL